MRHPWMASLVLTLAAIPAAAAARDMPAFTADFVTTVEGNKNEGRIYSSGTKIRNEMKVGEQHTTSILDLDKKQMYMLLPAPIGCMQTPLSADPKQHPLAVPGVSTKEEKIGSETIDGHPTDKYRVTTTVEGEDYEMYEWRATDLQNVVIRMSDPKGSYETVYKNVKLGAPDAKLFEPPASCQQMPAMGGLGAPPRQ